MATKCSVTVQVRVRPILLNKREEAEGTGGICVKVNGNTTIISDPTDSAKKRSFTFDRSFNSMRTDAPDFASQEAIYREVGKPSLEQAMRGYNATVFAYGQTGSGKTYTMMGHEDTSVVSTKRFMPQEELPPEVGVIPRFCTEMFYQLDKQARDGSGTVSHRVDSVYYEIYNDKVHDLLDSGSSRTYRVREHPKHGPYVEGLSHQEVKNYHDISRLLKRGSAGRHTAKTSMNDVSSRSHAVLELVLTTSRFDPNSGDLCDTSSRIALVDLAGSERQRAANTEGERLKEGAHINKGLLSLGNVIEALAANADRKGKTTRFVQYRDSTLTWLLREALGGNSKTIMIATVSPSSLNYEESLSTLKYADRAKKIQNAVSVNRDSKKQIIFALREEIKILKKEIEDLRSGAIPLSGDDALAGSYAPHDIRVWKEQPYLLQIDPLPTLHDKVLFWIEGDHTCYVSCADHTGTDSNYTEATPQAPMTTADHTIQLSKGKGIEEFHALFIREGDVTSLVPTCGTPYDGKAIAPTPRVDEKVPELLVDGVQMSGREKLVSGSHIQVGEYQFIFVDPDNISDCFQFHQRCAKLERAKAAQEKQVQVTAKRVHDMLIGSGLEASSLPSMEEGLAQRGREGDQILVRGDKGPAVYVWKGDSDKGGWVPADTMEAELAAVALVDKKKAEVECSRRLTTILGGSVDMKDLPAETDLPRAGPIDGDAGPKLVRSKDTGLKVMQWDQELKRWTPVTEPVAELTARNMVDVCERKKREKHAEQFRKELEERVTDLDDARKQLAEASEVYEAKEERFRKQLADKQYREEELLKQLNDKDRLLQSHKQSAAQEKQALQAKIETLCEEYEERLAGKEHIIQSLESSYSSAKYEWHKNETLLETAVRTKDKIVEDKNRLREELSQAAGELAQVRLEVDALKDKNTEQDHAIKRMTKELNEARDMRRESASEEVKQMQMLLEKKDSILQTLVEEKEQVDGNLRRLSKQYLVLQEELKEQQSRLVEYGELKERAQEAAREEGDKSLQLAKEVEQLKQEKQDLITKIKAVQNDPKKKEQELKRRQENEALKERLELLEQERKQAEGSRNYAEQTARSEKQRVSDLQQRVKETTKQYQVMKEAYERETEALSQSRQQLATQKEELNSLKTQLQQIKASPGFVTGAEQGRRDLDLSIQLEMVREENQRLQQKLADERMLRERSTESGRQLAKEKLEAEEALRKMKKEYKEAQAQLMAMTSRADRLKEMSQKLQSEALRKSKHESDDPPMTGRRTQPYGPSHGYTTPRKSTGPSTGRKRSVSNEIKVPSYAKPTGAWIARDHEGDVTGAALNASQELASSSKSTSVKRGPSPSAKGQTPRKSRGTKSGNKSARQPSPTPQASSPPPGGVLSPSPRGARASKRADADPRRSSSAAGCKTEEF